MIFTLTTNIDYQLTVPQNHVKSPTDNGNIRSLTDAILDNCIEKTIDGSYQLNRTTLVKLSAILTQFLDTKAEREIQCLHAITRRIVDLEHPSGVMHEILTCLYDNFALSKKGLFMWRDDNDPHEQEGKGKENSTRFDLNIFLIAIIIRSRLAVVHNIYTIREAREGRRFNWR